jgi:hypothetical protein
MRLRIIFRQLREQLARAEDEADEKAESGLDLTAHKAKVKTYSEGLRACRPGRERTGPFFCPRLSRVTCLLYAS